MKSLVYTDRIYFSNNDFEDYKEYSEYNKDGYCTKMSKSSSTMGKDFNGTYRIFDPVESFCTVEYHLQDGDTTSKSEFFYNYGKLTSEKYYSWGRYYRTTTFETNKFGYPISEQSDLKSGNTTIKFYDYDQNGRQILDVRLSDTWKKYHYWEYNENGNLVAETVGDSNWAPRTTTKRHSDGTSTSTTEKGLKTDGSYTLLYFYNALGQNTKIIELNHLRDTTTIVDYTYNEFGDPITQSYWSEKNDETYHFTYTYKYDKVGNWIERIMRDEEGNINRKEKMVIKYYTDK